MSDTVQSAPAETPAPAPTGAPAPAPAPAPSFDTIEQVLRFDPFEGKGQVAGPDGGQEPDPGTTVEVGKSPPPAPAPEPQAQQPVAPQAGPDVAAAITQLQQTLEAGVSVRQPAAGADAQPADHLPAYDFQVPPQLMQMLGSEDVAQRTQGVAALLKGAGRSIHTQVMREVIQTMQQHIPALVQGMIQNHTVAQTVRADFYGKYPQLNKAEVRPVIAQLGAQVLAEGKFNAYSPELRDEIYRRFVGLVNGMGLGQMPQPQPQMQTPQPPHINGSGTRGTLSQAGVRPNSQDDVMATLFG